MRHRAAGAARGARPRTRRVGGKILNILWQVGILFLVCLAAQWLVTLLPFAFPASVLAMILVFLLLLAGIIKVRQIKELSNWFAQNMAFLFVPACAGVLNYFDIIAANLFPILFISTVTTFLVFGATGWTVKGLMRLQARLREGKGGRDDG